MINEVYLDMDGVITNWDEQVDLYKVRKESGKANWDKICKIGSSFWINMPWLIDGHRLYLGILDLQKKYNFKLGILSAIFSKSGKIGKKYWLERNCPEINPENIIICDRAVNKQEFALANRLLIDDVVTNCYSFVEKGGNAILYTTYKEVLYKLEELLKRV